MAGGAVLETTEEFHDLATLVRAKARKNGDRVALRFPDRALSYREVDSASDRVAAGLRAEGIAPGERVAALLSNRPEFPLLWFGAAKAGLVFVPLNTALKGELLRYELEDCAPSAVVTEPAFEAAYAEARPSGRAPKRWTVDGAANGSEAGVPDFASLLASSAEPPDGTPGPADPAEILYTSGTTGRPKGALLPHQRMVNTPREIGLRARLDPGSVLYTALPLFHCNAQEKTTLVAWLNDLTAVLDDRFHASDFWERAGRFGATHVSLLTSMITVLWKQPERATDRTHGVRVATASGTTRALWRPFEERFGISVVESYGMTECGCTTLMNPPGGVRLGSVGTPLGFVEAQVVDAADRPVPAGTPGELVVRPTEPFTMFLGYYGKPEQTVEAWRNLWFHTGDLLRADADGYYYFVDRVKDVIRRRGENIAPYDVETVLNEHPAVLESVVVAVPSELGEDDVKAFVQLREGRAVPAEELFRFAEERLPRFMVPRYLEFVAEIPKTANQKAIRSRLRGRRTGREVDRTTDVRPPSPPPSA